MCGRFDVDSRNEEIQKLLKALPTDERQVRTGEIFPGNTALALAGTGGDALALTWGFPRHEGKGLIINARSETAADKRMFSNSLKKSRAAIPATGYFEWTKPEKQKYLFTAPDNKLLYFAGLWKEIPEEENPYRFVILTTQANPGISRIHERMPVLLQKHEVEAWLDGRTIQEILKRVPFEVNARLVE